MLLTNGKRFVIVGDEKHFSSLDFLDTLTCLITKLPYELRRRWIKRFVQMENTTGTLAKSSHFVDFVQYKSEELNSIFGLRSLNVKQVSKGKALSYSISAPCTSKNTKKPSGKSPGFGACWYCYD